MSLQKLLPLVLIIIAMIYHSFFLHLNEVLKVADSFAYLQMARHLQEFSVLGMGNGWFGMAYSIPLALIGGFISDIFLAAQITNILLFGVLLFILYRVSRMVLGGLHSLLLLGLCALSPVLLHFNIHILSENLYLPLFLWTFYLSYKLFESVQSIGLKTFFLQSVLLGSSIACLYLTRAEAFIYLGAVGLIAFGFLASGRISFQRFLLGGVFLVGAFIVFISPYLFYLHGLTGEWGLTNKGASNIRQAQLRGQDRMDDLGFEQAVAELSDDNTQLIAGFAGGMEYVKPQIEGSLMSFIADDPQGFLTRVGGNWKKFFSRNIVEIFLGKSLSLYFSQDARFTHPFFALYCLIPLLILLYGFVVAYRRYPLFLGIFMAYFSIAFLFFTLFFVLNRYFLVFLPLLLVFFLLGLDDLASSFSEKKVWVGRVVLSLGALQYISILLLSTSVYYHIENPKDEYYALKREAGVWLADNFEGDPRIMERFPIVTYYSNATLRFITPYSDNFEDIYEYAVYNAIDILVVDTMDFEKYRPGLRSALSRAPDNYTLLQSFESGDAKVLLYRIEK